MNNHNIQLHNALLTYFMLYCSAVGIDFEESRTLCRRLADAVVETAAIKCSLRSAHHPPTTHQIADIYTQSVEEVTLSVFSVLKELTPAQKEDMTTRLRKEILSLT